MSYRSYMGGFCKHCGLALGLIEVGGGRIRRYCDDACRKAASRERLKRDRAVGRNEAFMGLWDENGIVGEVREQLVDILVKYGRDACRDATHAVITMKKSVDGWYLSRAISPAKAR